MAKDWTQEEAAKIDAEDAGVKQELTSAEYWQTQAAMWHNKYVEAHQYELDHEMFKEALERLATGKVTAERAKQIALKALNNRKVQ